MAILNLAGSGALVLDGSAAQTRIKLLAGSGSIVFTATASLGDIVEFSSDANITLFTSGSLAANPPPTVPSGIVVAYIKRVSVTMPNPTLVDGRPT